MGSVNVYSIERLHGLLSAYAKKTELGSAAILNAGTEPGQVVVSGDPRIFNTLVPRAPTNFNVSSAVDFVDGVSVGVISASWSPVTKATDDSDITISRYELWAKDNDLGTEQWFFVGLTSDTNVEASWFKPGTSYTFKVRGFMTRSTTPGQWSSEVIRAMLKDAVAPSVPSAPTLRTKFGNIYIDWDGTPAMEPDFDKIEVGMAYGETSTLTVIDYMVAKGTVSISGQAYNELRWFALRSVDRTGNKSEWSARASIATTPLVDIEAIIQRIDEASIEINASGQTLAEKQALLLAAAQARKITTSESTPSGTALAGHLWWRVDGTGKVIGQWEQTASPSGSTWTVREVTSEVIANLDVGKLTATSALITEAVVNKLWAEVVRARKITTDMLLVGAGANLMPWAPWETTEPHVGQSSSVLDTVNDPDFGWCLRTNGATITVGTQTHVAWLRSSDPDTDPSYGWAVEEGESYRFRIGVSAGGVYTDGTPQAAAIVAFYDKTGTWMQSAYAPEVNPAWSGTPTYVEVTGKAPVGAKGMRIFIRQNRPGMLMWFGAALHRMSDASLIVDGGILARHIEALQIEAGHIKSNAVTADKIMAGAVETDKIALGAIGYDRLGIGTEELMPNPMWMNETLREQITLGAGFTWWGEHATYGLNGQADMLYLSSALSGATASQTVVTPTMIPVTPGERIFGSFTVLNDGGTPNYGVNLEANWYDEAGAGIYGAVVASVGATATSAHTEFNGIVTAPNGAAFVRFKVLVGTTPGGESRNTWYFINRVSLRRVLSASESSGPTTEISPKGLKIWYEKPASMSDQADIDLGVESQGLTIRDANNVAVASITSSGVTTKKSMSTPALEVSEQLTYRGNDLGLESGARMVARADYGLPGQTIPVGGNIDVRQLTFRAKPGRSYRVHALGPLVNLGGIAGNYGSAKIKVGYGSTIPSYNTTAEATTVVFFNCGYNTFHSTWYYYNTKTYEENVTILYNIAAGPSNTAVTHGTYKWVRIVVEDIGPTALVSDQGVAPTNSSSGTTTPVLQTYTVEDALEWGNSYVGAGTDYNYNNHLLYQGQYLSNNGILKSMIGIKDAMRTAISGATINKVELFLYAAHWYYNSGGKALVGVHGIDNQPSTFSHTANSVDVSFAKGESKWVTIASAHFAGFGTGTYKGFTLGGWANTDKLYYGYFDKDSTRVRITYTK